MHITCPDISPLPEVGCDGQPFEFDQPITITGTYHPTEGERAFLNKIQEDGEAQLQSMKQQVDEYVEQLLTQVTPEMLKENGGRFQLVVANPTMASIVRTFLEERGHDYIDVVVAAPVPYRKTKEEDYWTPAMSEAKAAYARSHDALGQRVRHHSQFTKSQPTAKARKAARKRAKAGRKASR